MNQNLSDLFMLYIEDDESNRTVMKLLMERAINSKRYEIFSDSSDFLSKLRALPVVPEIILLDIHISPHNGFEMLRMIRSEAPYSKAKVIAITASVMNEEIQRLRESGFDGAIGKPLNLSTFPSLLQVIADGGTVWSVT